jgi:hypothetical protein
MKRTKINFSLKLEISREHRQSGKDVVGFKKESIKPNGYPSGLYINNRKYSVTFEIILIFK